MQLIEWFKSSAPEGQRVTYVGGTPARWRTLTANSRIDPKWERVYAAMDVIQPWTVGRYRTLDGVDQWKDQVLVPDLKLTTSGHQVYMPVVFPGSPGTTSRKVLRRTRSRGFGASSCGDRLTTPEQQERAC